MPKHNPRNSVMKHIQVNPKAAFILYKFNITMNQMSYSLLDYPKAMQRVYFHPWIKQIYFGQMDHHCCYEMAGC